jgi:hypothetical protein
VKSDDSSLTSDQYRTVHQAARRLLDRGDAWGRLPTPIDDLLAAAKLQLAPISAFDEGALRRYLRQAGQQAERLLRRALDKVLGIFDVHADIVHIDPTLRAEKQTFLTLHETGHKEIPHQSGLFRWIQDCDKHLSPDIAALFEREANTFATIALFQDDGFAAMIADSEFGIKVPINTARRFGASVYAGIREYVRRNTKACAAVILEPTEIRAGLGQVATVRRIELSPEFRRRFGMLELSAELTIADGLMKAVPQGNRRMSSPRSFAYADRNGDRHEFIAEGFRTPYNTFILIHSKSTLSRSIQATAAILF